MTNGPMNRRRVVCWISLCLLAWGAVPGAVRAQSLMEAIEAARANDPRLKAAQAEFRAVQTSVDQARAGIRPVARFDVDRMETHQRTLSTNSSITSSPVNEFPTRTQVLSISQPIYRKDVFERMAQAETGVKQANFSLMAVEQDLLLRTTSAYLVLMASLDVRALAQAERETVGKALDSARERLLAGVGTIINQVDAQARFAVTQARVIEADNKVRDAQQALREITGRSFETVWGLRDDFQLEPPDPASIEQWLEAARAQNLELSARRALVEFARQDIERQRAGHYPSVNLLLQNTLRDGGLALFGGSSKTRSTELSLKLSVPIFEGGLTSAAIKEAIHRHAKAQAELEGEERAVERAIRLHHEGVLAGIDLTQALRQSVDAQSKALEAKELSHRSGLITLLPVLDAQRDLYQARREYEQSRYEYVLNRLRLRQLIGALSDADLKLIDQSGSKVTIAATPAAHPQVEPWMKAPDASPAGVPVAAGVPSPPVSGNESVQGAQPVAVASLPPPSMPTPLPEVKVPTVEDLGEAKAIPEPASPAASAAKPDPVTAEASAAPTASHAFRRAPAYVASKVRMRSVAVMPSKTRVGLGGPGRDAVASSRPDASDHASAVDGVARTEAFTLN